MRSTQEKRWIVKKYTGEPLSYGKDLRPLVEDNHWLKIVDDVQNMIQIKCPGCHRFLAISIVKKDDNYNNHDIDDKGVITPSVGCLTCGFHEWVKLDGWKP